MSAGAPPRPDGIGTLARIALAMQLAVIPLYGTLVVLDAERPPIPPLVPRAGAIAIGLLMLAALAAALPAARRVVRWDWFTFAYLGGGLATILAAIPGFDPPIGIGLGVLVSGIGAAGLVLARSADAATVRLCVRSFLWSALLASLLALAMVLAHRPAAIYAYDNGRAVGTFLNPNELAAFTLMGLGVAVPLAVATRGRDRLAVVTAAVLAVTLGATFSRWGLLSAVVGIAVYALAARARVLLVAALAVAVAGIALDAAGGARHHNSRDTEARTVAWRTGLTTIERFPLLGVGPLAFPKTYDVLRPPDAPGTQTAVAFDPHSLPIAFAAGGGMVAVVTLAAGLTIILRRVLRDARGAPAVPRALGFALAAAALALLFDSGINTISLIFPLILQVATLGIAVVRTDALS
ncbi:MAG TPA: O-antigen ligase family protein [Candidatus Elarobacter sp.]|jgi:O-antigen ligase|nr:O-antigen ligase family protein [Candidatus Elarobacter sp.]